MGNEEDRLKYGFKPFIWQVGGKFTWPLDKDNFEYHYPRGFDDCFTIETRSTVQILPVSRYHAGITRHFFHLL